VQSCCESLDGSRRLRRSVKLVQMVSRAGNVRFLFDFPLFAVFSSF
jgi:hypothetical protein